MLCYFPRIIARWPLDYPCTVHGALSDLTGRVPTDQPSARGVPDIGPESGRKHARIASVIDCLMAARIRSPNCPFCGVLGRDDYRDNRRGGATISRHENSPRLQP